MNFRLFSGLTLLLVLSFSTGCVSRLFYHPSPILRETPEVLGIDYEDVYFPSEDGTRLHGWFLPARTQPGWATVVQLHGNAHNVSSHYRYVTWLVAEGVNVLCFDYRGYGLSEGKPERAGILRREGLRQVWEGTFAEYYEPFTGEPLGSPEQSWTAAVVLDWLA